MKPRNQALQGGWLIVDESWRRSEEVVLLYCNCYYSNLYFSVPLLRSDKLWRLVPHRSVAREAECSRLMLSSRVCEQYRWSTMSEPGSSVSKIYWLRKGLNGWKIGVHFPVGLKVILLAAMCGWGMWFTHFPLKQEFWGLFNWMEVVRLTLQRGGI